MDVPVKYEERWPHMLINRKVCDGRGIVLSTGFGSGVDNGKNAVASHRVGERLPVDEKLFTAEEGDSRPIDKFSKILLSVDEGIVVPDEVRLKLSAAFKPNRFCLT